jgi:hypothetical protein
MPEKHAATRATNLPNKIPMSGPTVLADVEFAVLPRIGNGPTTIATAGESWIVKRIGAKQLEEDSNAKICKTEKRWKAGR